MERKICY